MRDTIVKLQEKMKQEQLDYYYILSEDDHLSEYVAPHDRVREYMTGFTGSAGTLLVTAKEAYLWTDGRYFLQAEEQLEGSGIALMRSGEDGVLSVGEWLCANASSGQRIGFDGRTMRASVFKRLQTECERTALTFCPQYTLAGDVWEEEGTRPALAFHPIQEWPPVYAGESMTAKCERLRTFFSEQAIACYAVTDLAEIAWLFNMRGSDIVCSPVAFAYLLVTLDTFTLYVDVEQMEESLAANLKSAGVVLQPYDQFYRDLQQCTVAVSADASSANVLVSNAVNESGGKWIPSPIASWKAVKNAQEIAGERSAHIKDGVAMVNFLYWLKHLRTNRAGVLLDEDGNAVTECSAALRLEQERARQEGYVGPSFEPIVAAGAHGAIVHYSATAESAADLTLDQFVLMDTGGQYLEGTTDITRTVALGTVSGQMKSIYTAVLCGHLDLTHALFAKGCRGENLDVIARMPIWKKGYDYQHGTGHGVGCYLNVHEEPVSIRTRIYDDERNSAVLEPGMVTSNEPGVYVADEFGIRLENMLVCVERTKTDYQTFYGFEPLTMVPFDKDALLLEELDDVHKELLNQYHLAVYQALNNYLEPEVDDWLFDITRPIR